VSAAAPGVATARTKRGGRGLNTSEYCVPPPYAEWAGMAFPPVVRFHVERAPNSIVSISITESVGLGIKG